MKCVVAFSYYDDIVVFIEIAYDCLFFSFLSFFY